MHPDEQIAPIEQATRLVADQLRTLEIVLDDLDSW